MTKSNIDSTIHTDMHTIDQSSTSATTFLWEVTSVSTDGATGQKEYTWQCTEWTKYLGYYHTIPMLASSFDRKAMWTVGQGFKQTSNAFMRFIKGEGLKMRKETFTSIIYNLDRVGQISGDCFAEKIENSQGRLINLKPLSPGSIKIIVNEVGIIVRYEQTSNTDKPSQKFKPEQIFHISFNKIADEVHGISEIIKVEDVIKMQKEAKLDQKTLLHRFVKPIIFFGVDTDDTTKISNFKKDVDKAVELGENVVIPNDVMDKMDRLSIPQSATLDPLPWINSLNKEQVLACGVPLIVLGTGSQEDTEASSKIIYVAFESYIKFRQLFWEEQIKNQLGIEIKLNPPPSLLPELQADNKKDGQLNKPLNTDPRKHE